MRHPCYGCGKSVTSEMPDDSVIRAVLICPECMPAWLKDDVKSPLIADDEEEEEAP